MTPLPSILLSSLLESAIVMTPVQIADVVSTRMAVRRDQGRDPDPQRLVIEANPLIGRDANLARMLAIKIPLTAVMVYGDWKIGKKSKTAQWIGRGAVIVGVAVLGVKRNVENGRGR